MSRVGEAAEFAAVESYQSSRRSVRLGHARNQLHQALDIATLHGQGLHVTLLDSDTKVRCRCLHQRDGGGHFNGLRRPPQLESHVDRRLIVCFDFDPANVHWNKPCHFEMDFVRPRHQLRKKVEPGAVGLCRLLYPRVHIGDGNVRPDHHRPLRIGHSSAD